MTLKGALYLIITAGLTITGQIMMKRGLPVSGSIGVRQIFGSPLLIIGALCYVASFFSWLQVLNLLPLSIALPSMSINYILIIYASAIFLGEPVTAMKLIGVFLIFGGVLFISQG